MKFPFGRKSLRATLVEIPMSEWSYIRRMREEPTGLKSQEDHPFWQYYKTDFAPLETAWRELVEYLPNPKVRVRTITGGIAGQLLFHEIHHRAQAMAMLRMLGVPAENLDYSILMVERTQLPA